MPNSLIYHHLSANAHHLVVKGNRTDDGDDNKSSCGGSSTKMECLYSGSNNMSFSGSSLLY